MRQLAARILIAAAFAAVPGSAGASVVTHGYLPLPDGTELAYTLTLPQATGRFPVVMQYDPYAAGATSDPTWNEAGYAMLGVNMRGTGCSQGVFNMVRADIWGADGGKAVDWAAKQPWSDGTVAMLGYSFTGTSQIATAAYAGPALKAIMPGNVFPDLYGDISYPGGVYNALDPAWIAAARQFVVGTQAFTDGLTDPTCDSNEAQALAPNVAQTADTTAHPFRDDYWAHDPRSLASRVHVPILGCVNWQDMTVYSRAFDQFRTDYAPKTTWLVGGNGAHGDCPISRARRVRFLDHYLKGEDNGWPAEPHLLLVHEVATSPGRDKMPENVGNWQSSLRSWADVDRAIKPLTLYLHEGGRMDLNAPGAAEPPASYAYTGHPGGNKPELFPYPAVPGTSVSWTTPKLAHDVEYLGSGSANLWLSSTAPDTSLQLAVTEIRPDGQESFVANGWLQVSHRKLDEKASTALKPVLTDLQADAQTLTPGTPVAVRVQIQPFDHVFRAGSAIRLSVDAPAASLVGLPGPAQNTIYNDAAMPSQIVLGQLPERALTPLCLRALLCSTSRAARPRASRRRGRSTCLSRTSSAIVVFCDRSKVGLTDAERAVLEACPTVTMVDVADSGHMVMADQPASSAELIREIAVGS